MTPRNRGNVAVALVATVGVVAVLTAFWQVASVLSIMGDLLTPR